MRNRLLDLVLLLLFACGAVAVTLSVVAYLEDEPIPDGSVNICHQARECHVRLNRLLKTAPGEPVVLGRAKAGAETLLAPSVRTKRLERRSRARGSEGPESISRAGRGRSDRQARPETSSRPTSTVPSPQRPGSPAEAPLTPPPTPTTPEPLLSPIPPVPCVQLPVPAPPC